MQQMAKPDNRYIHELKTFETYKSYQQPKQKTKMLTNEKYKLDIFTSKKPCSSYKPHKKQ